MQNDVLRNTISPWQEKGRWYHAAAEIENGEWILLEDESDSFFSASASFDGDGFTISNDTRYALIEYYIKPRSGLPAEAEISYLKYIAYCGTGYIIYLPNREDGLIDGFILDMWFFIDKVE